MKFSIVMAYFNNRKEQTINTLNSIKNNYYPYYSFEVIIVDDNAEPEFKLYDIIENYPFYINYIVISKEEKGNTMNPCIAYNKGFAATTGDVIIIQNPECMHVGDIIFYLVNNLKEDDYVSFSCFSTNCYDINIELVNSANKFEKINNPNFLSRNHMGINWYNHPQHRPVGYHFCSAIFKNKLDIIGGFDESYAEGHSYDDNDFLLEIKYKLKLNIIILNPSDVFVIHQYHSPNYCTDMEKLEKNKILFENKRKYYLNK